MNIVVCIQKNPLNEPRVDNRNNLLQINPNHWQRFPESEPLLQNRTLNLGKNRINKENHESSTGPSGSTIKHRIKIKQWKFIFLQHTLSRQTAHVTMNRNELFMSLFFRKLQWHRITRRSAHWIQRKHRPRCRRQWEKLIENCIKNREKFALKREKQIREMKE